MNLAVTRLTEERKQWRKDHPFGFSAKPVPKADGSLDLLCWECLIPGKANTPYEGGTYKIILQFPESYPANAPKCTFTPPLFHPNIFQTGAVCLSILNQDWKASLTVKQILLGIQELLNDPNPKSPANSQAYDCYRLYPQEYLKKVKEQALKNKPAL